MAGNLGKWLSKRGPISKIKPSDGCKGDTLPLTVERWYDFHSVGCHLGNVGLHEGLVSLWNGQRIARCSPLPVASSP